MLVHPLCCNDDRAGEIGPTFHFMTRHDLVLANDSRAQETRISLVTGETNSANSTIPSMICSPNTANPKLLPRRQHPE